MNELKPCPCGQTPTILILNDTGQGSKWAEAKGDCCGTWGVEFRTLYRPLDDPRCMLLAIDEWNEAPRGGVTK